MLEVWLDHSKTAEFPETHTHRVVGNDLHVVNPHGQVVKIFKEGEWHGAGIGLACAFVEDDPSCESCHPTEKKE